MAGVLLVREAGGFVSRIDGGPVDLESGSILGAATPELACALAGLLRGP